MRPLIIDERAKTKLLQIKKYAEANVYSSVDLVKISNGIKEPPGEIPMHVARVDVGYRVVFSMEEQKAGKIRHLSVSVDTSGKLPSPHDVQALMEELGFEEKLRLENGQPNSKLLVAEEIFGDNIAINVYEIVKEVK